MLGMADTELAEMADFLRLGLQNLCSAASDVLSDVPDARDELKARLDESDRVLRRV